jgi:hypothetical protein
MMNFLNLQQEDIIILLNDPSSKQKFSLGQ